MFPCFHTSKASMLACFISCYRARRVNKHTNNNHVTSLDLWKRNISTEGQNVPQRPKQVFSDTASTDRISNQTGQLGQQTGLKRKLTANVSLVAKQLSQFMVNVIFIKTLKHLLDKTYLNFGIIKAQLPVDWRHFVKWAALLMHLNILYDQIQTSHGFYGAILKQARAAEHNILDKIVLYHKRLVVILFKKKIIKTD